MLVIYLFMYPFLTLVSVIFKQCWKPHKYIYKINQANSIPFDTLYHNCIV